jgi:hypothetical protein
MSPRTTMGALNRGRRVVNDLTAARWLLVSAFSLVSAIRLGLWVLPVRTVGRILGWFVRREPEGTSDPSLPGRVGLAVTWASRVVPGATCLTQALAAQVLLERRGLPTRLHIGIARDQQAVRAQAWLESQGVTVIGGAMSEHWRPLLTVEGARTWASPAGRPS